MARDNMKYERDCMTEIPSMIGDNEPPDENTKCK